MNAKSENEKLQRIIKEKKAQKNEHKRRQEEEVGLLKRKKTKKKLQRIKHEGQLNIQSLAIRSLPHYLSSLECAKGKAYNEKIQFAQTIIHDIDITGTSIVEFLHISRKMLACKCANTMRSYINGSITH